MPTRFERASAKSRAKVEADWERHCKGQGVANGRTLKYQSLLMVNPFTRQQYTLWHIFDAANPTELLASTGSFRRAEEMVAGQRPLESDDLWKNQL